MELLLSRTCCVEEKWIVPKKLYRISIETQRCEHRHRLGERKCPRESYSHLIQLYPHKECLLNYSDFLTTVELTSQYSFHESTTSTIYNTNLIDTIIENLQNALNEEIEEINVIHWRALILYSHAINMLKSAMLVFFTDVYDHDEGMEVLRNCIEFCNDLTILNNADSFSFP